jgi:hypothetical protein
VTTLCGLSGEQRSRGEYLECRSGARILDVHGDRSREVARGVLERCAQDVRGCGGLEAISLETAETLGIRIQPSLAGLFRFCLNDPGLASWATFRRPLRGLGRRTSEIDPGRLP